MSFLPANADKIYVNILGGAAAVSVAHYLLTFSDVRSPVAIRYNLDGQVNKFVNKRYYIFYPVCVAAMSGVGYVLRDNKTVAITSVDQPAVWGIMVCSVFLTLSGQVFAHRIAAGKSRKMPTAVTVVGAVGIAAGVAYCVVNAVSKK